METSVREHQNQLGCRRRIKRKLSQNILNNPRQFTDGLRRRLCYEISIIAAGAGFLGDYLSR